eukprot:Amastigsp_a678908_3.p3 type:complete len:128 gc:universal Amastigsp_a678908_3:1335-952(-)
MSRLGIAAALRLRVAENGAEAAGSAAAPGSSSSSCCRLHAFCNTRVKSVLESLVKVSITLTYASGDCGGRDQTVLASGPYKSASAHRVSYARPKIDSAPESGSALGAPVERADPITTAMVATSSEQP